MTVKNLIKELKKHPKNSDVITDNIAPNKEKEFVFGTFMDKDGYTILSTYLK
jgi:hypothetical protein